jgi:hypothetical protein
MVKRQDPQRSVVRPLVTDEAQAIDDLEPFYHIDRVAQRAVDQRSLGSFLASPPKRDDRAHSHLGEGMPERLDQTLRIGFLLPVAQRGVTMQADFGMGRDPRITFWAVRGLAISGKSLLDRLETELRFQRNR